MSSTNLYDLTGQFLMLQEMLMDPDIDPQIIEDTLESIDCDYELKLEAYGKIIKNFDAAAEAAKKEEQRIANRRKYFENQSSRMKDRIKDSMLTIGKSQVRTNIFLYSIKKGTPSLKIDNETGIPEKYREKQPDKILKAELTKFIKANGDTAYAHMEVGEPSLLMK